MKRSVRKSRGFTMIIAVAMFVLLAAAITALTTVFASETQRTQSTVQGAQIRQILLASTVIATDELQKNGSAARQITPAIPVADAQLTLTFKAISEEKVEVLALVGFRQSKASQTLTFTRNSGRPLVWTLESATFRSAN